jgi:hypothetical protein
MEKDGILTVGNSPLAKTMRRDVFPEITAPEIGPIQLKLCKSRLTYSSISHDDQFPYLAIHCVKEPLWWSAKIQILLLPQRGARLQMFKHSSTDMAPSEVPRQRTRLRKNRRSADGSYLRLRMEFLCGRIARLFVTWRMIYR